jgi:cytochrome c553
VKSSIHRVGAVLLLLAGVQPSWGQNAQPQQPAAGVQNTMAQRMQACVACHGKEGRATNQGYFPRIAGKPAGYLYNQLQNFKSGLRRYEAMNHLVQHMSDDYLRDIAKYFAELDLPYPPAQVTKLTPEENRAAENLVLRGAPDRGIPACVSCHGQQMAGMLPAMPGLLTLPSDYLAAQMGAWRAGQRKAKAPDCMADIAKRLAPEEVSVMAKWLSAQTLPTGVKPAPPSGQPLPIRCGSGEQ